MDWFERNFAILEEIRGVPELHVGARRGESSKLRFHSAGQYRSEACGGPLHLGVKLFKSGKPSDVTLYFYKSLKCLYALRDEAPELLDELPACYGLVAGEQGLGGIVTEDFTRDGAVRDVQHPMRWRTSIVPEAYCRLLYDASELSLQDEVHHFLMVDGVRKFADLDTVPLRRELDRRYLDEAVATDLEPYAVCVPLR